MCTFSLYECELVFSFKLLGKWINMFKSNTQPLHHGNS